MNKIIAVACLLFVGALAAAEDISVVGTGSGMDLLEKVAQEFMKTKSGVKILVPPSVGSGGGITAVDKDKAVLGRVSRPLKDSEKALGLSYVEFAKLPIVFYTHPSCGVKSLTRAQVMDVFGGKVKNWKEVGGNDLPIIVVKREKGDSSLDVLTQSMAGFSGENMSKDAKTQFTDQKAIAYVVAWKGSIAFGSLANTVGEDLTVLSVDGVDPLDKGYPFLGVIALIYKEKNLKGNVKAFVDYVTSANAKPVIVKASGIPF